MGFLFGDSMARDCSKTYVTGESYFWAFWRTAAMDCKAYPIRRLTKMELDEEELRLSSLLDGTDDDTPAPLSWEVIERNMRYWSFSLTESELFTMVLSSVAKVGDEVVVLDGGKVPIVLRATVGDSDQGTKTYRVVHVAYVHGFMDGEALKWASDGRLEEAEFSIV